jgi:hypothetical protein
LKKIKGSLVIKDPQILEMLQQWVGEEGIVTEYEKIFTASKDGWSSLDFH